jgi:HSP20 family protein
MDELFGGLLAGWGMGWVPFRVVQEGVSAYAPRVDVEETDTELRVTVELPGMDEKDVDVSLDRGVLAIRGEKKTEHQEKGKRAHWVERSYGTFQRAIPLPIEAVDQDTINASFKKGVLTVTLPKTADVKRQARKIDVKPQ